jgi:site-specific recombinase XerD
MRLLIDTGIRRCECAGILLEDDLDLDEQLVSVIGKGGVAAPWRSAARPR